MRIRLYTLTGKFDVVSTHDVEGMTEATDLVRAHINGSGYTNLRTVEDEDGYSIRFIADPSIGRKGRNVASIDF